MKRRLLITTTAGLAVGLLAITGWFSSRATLATVDGRTRASVSASIRHIQDGFRRLPPSPSFPYHALLPVSWTEAVQDNDPVTFQGPWYWFAVRYRPSATPIRGGPWAFVRTEPGPLPFLVRSYYGFETTGQAGAGGFDLYLTFFGSATRIGRYELWIS